MHAYIHTYKHTYIHINVYVKAYRVGSSDLFLHEVLISFLSRGLGLLDCLYPSQKAGGGFVGIGGWQSALLMGNSKLQERRGWRIDAGALNWKRVLGYTLIL